MVAKDAHRTVPRAIVAAAVLGMLFLIALTVVIKDNPRISASGSPVAAIMRDQLGPVMERVLLVAVTFAFFGAGVVTLTACARLVFAMARDGRFPAHRLMRLVSPRTQTPIPATVLIFALGVVLMVALPGAALLELITASTILPALIFFLVMLTVDREVLETEPGDMSGALPPLRGRARPPSRGCSPTRRPVPAGCPVAWALPTT
ncbi:APC family permease [Streptomyces sp. NPDC057011]|uniref:APC family permease n=1 Tax=unclassified Streptomyces TaxID=2593676 RepID=UPI0036345737